MAKTKTAAKSGRTKPVAAAAQAVRSNRKPAAAKVVRESKPVASIEPVRPAVEIEEGNIEMAKDTNQAVTDRVQAIFGDVNERARTAFEKNARLVEELTELTRGNVEALVASSKVAARGVEALSQEAADYSRKSFEEASAALRGFTEIKSPTDLFRLQSEFAKSQFDSIVAESSKVSEAVIKLAGEVFEPLSSRYSVAAERVKSAIAA
jgi:phasin family protein